MRFGLGNPIASAEEFFNKNIKHCIDPPITCVFFKSQIVKKIKFRNEKNERGKSVEDLDWLLRIYPNLVTEKHNSRELHFYNFSSANSRS